MEYELNHVKKKSDKPDRYLETLKVNMRLSVRIQSDCICRSDLRGPHKAKPEKILHLVPSSL